jgi:GDP-L-fucose synthase
MHFIYDLVRKILEAKATGQPAVLWGDGSQRREIVHAQDFVNAMLKLVNNDRAVGEVINLGAGTDCTIREFASEICRQTRTPESLVAYDTGKYVGAKAKRLDTAKVTRLIPWTPRGVQECVTDVIRAVSEHRGSPE